MRKYIFGFLALVILFSSCKQEVIEPQQQLSGMFALDDGSGLTDYILDFSQGVMSVLTTDDQQKYAFVNGKIWHADKSDFHLSEEVPYSISDKHLLSKIKDYGVVYLENGILMLGDSRYVAVSGFEQSYYSKIECESTVTVPSLVEQDVTVPCSIVNPLPGGRLTAKSKPSWVTGVSLEGPSLVCHVSLANKECEGLIRISYTGADDFDLHLKQTSSTFIHPESESIMFDYPASTQTFDCTIENPVASSTLSATSTASWISDIQVSDTRISFKASENNSGSFRRASVTLHYAGATDVNVSVIQRWSSSSLTLTPTSKDVDYTGGLFSFDYVVINPRENATLTAESQVDWITDVKVNGTNVSYKVAENNSKTSRSGKIKVAYGDYATAVFTVTQSAYPSYTISLDKTSLRLHVGETFTLIATVNPSYAVLSWTSSNPSVATVTASGQVKAISIGETTIRVTIDDIYASCSVTVRYPYVLNAVDLGLPSGLKWADCNLGAEKPEDYGDYYAWGEVEPYYSSLDPLIWKEGKTGYDWSSYKWCNGSSFTLTKYCSAYRPDYWDGEGSPDGNTVLEPEDDVAHVSLGGKWRMPTYAECTELITECTWTWTTQNGVNGRLVTGKNGNSIFLPAAGYRFNVVLCDAGSAGGYWSFSLNTDLPSYARNVYFNSSNVSVDNGSRYYGNSIRPVSE